MHMDANGAECRMHASGATPSPIPSFIETE